MAVAQQEASGVKDAGETTSDATVSERLEGGLDDTLDITTWNMPTVRDYALYLAVYGTAIAVAAYIVVRYQEPWAYAIWGGYIAVLLVFAALVVNSMVWRSRMLSKRFEASTLDLDEAIDGAIAGAGMGTTTKQGGGGGFLHPCITTYSVDGRGLRVRLEGRSSHTRKTVSIGRLPNDAAVAEARAFCTAMDAELDRLQGQKVRRSLFK
jgi:hypothetical protein